MFNIVWVEPEIPPNTGNLGRFASAPPLDFASRRSSASSRTDDPTKGGGGGGGYLEGARRARLFGRRFDVPVAGIRSVNCTRRRIRRALLLCPHDKASRPSSVLFSAGDFLVLLAFDTKACRKRCLRPNAYRFAQDPMTAPQPHLATASRSSSSTVRQVELGQRVN